MHKGQRAVITDLGKVRKTPTAISSLATPEKPRNLSKRVLYFVYRNKLLMQMKINVLVCQLYKNATFWFNSNKKDFIDSFHSFHKYLLSTYNVSGYWARPEDLMVNKKNSPCSHGAHGWIGQKDVNQKKFPQKNKILQSEINVVKAREMRGPRKVEKVTLELSSEIRE